MPEPLSREELAICAFARTGQTHLTYKQIADLTGLSFSQVRNRMKSIFFKKGVHSRAQLVAVLDQEAVRKGVPIAK